MEEVHRRSVVPVLCPIYVRARVRAGSGGVIRSAFRPALARVPRKCRHIAQPGLCTENPRVGGSTPSQATNQIK
jgi:hypothetical protein